MSQGEPPQGGSREAAEKWQSLGGVSWPPKSGMEAGVPELSDTLPQKYIAGFRKTHPKPAPALRPTF